MASSSSTRSLQLPQRKYDVFLSFRGKDTRRNFTSHLHEVLRNRGIFTFLDEERLEHGDSIPDELVKAIKDSQVAVIIFSKKYATSRWCLNELVKIMECKDKSEQTVIPVFYNVDPSHVRNQRKSFAKAFAKHESNYKDDIEGMQKVQGWRTALSEVANLKGCDTRGRIESECIRDLVDQISSKLCKTSSSYLQTVVGIDTHLKEVNSLLKMEIDDVRIVGIWGMGGIGKTTIARAIFHTLSYQFEAASFLADIKENEKKNQLHSLQNTLLSELLRRKDDYVYNKYDGKDMIQSRLHSLKVLIVLDDVDHSDHLEYLAGDHGWFGNGSRVVVTTRYRHLIENDDAIYEVPILPDHEAVKLFNQHAFKKEVPNDLFTKLSLEVVNHAKGLPLALKVWGSLLHKKGPTQWRRTVDQIKKNSSSEIVEKLKISYDGLEPEEQKIFLDMACFFRGYKKEKVMQILESCDFGAEYGLEVLIEKSLVFLSEGDHIQMHDLIQDMGKYIVKMQKDAGECSRLWDSEDFEEVMVNNTGTKAMEAIWIRNIQKLCLSKKAMKKMKQLRMLCIRGFDTHDGSIEYLPNSLRWFVFTNYPGESLPQKFEPKRLVGLNLRWSSLRHLWTGIKHFPCLRKLNLSGSDSLMRTPDFTEMPNLEYLNLSFCTNLEEVDDSLGYCGKLIRCNLRGCLRLERLPCVNLESFEYLDLRWCSSLKKFPEIKGRNKLGSFRMSYSKVRELPSSFLQYLTHLTELDLEGMENLVSLPSIIGMLKSLVKLYMCGCSKLESLPEKIGDLENLEILDASYTLISRAPPSIARLNKLKFLKFGKRPFLQDEVCFVFPQVNDGLRSLEELNLRYCNLIDEGLPEDIGSLSSLKKLLLRGNNFEYLPPSIAQLGALRYLELTDCKRLKELPEFPQQLDAINADWSYDWICNSLFQNISSLQHISASDSLSLRVFISEKVDIPSWFHHRGMDTSVSVNLPENWYVPNNFLGFAVCYTGSFVETTAQLIPLCDDEMSRMTQKLALSNHTVDYLEFPILQFRIRFFLVPFSSLWDTSKANGKTPNDYGRIRLSFSGEIKRYGFRLLYKDEPELEALLRMRENNDDPTEDRIMTRKSRYDDSEASSSSRKKQRSHSNIHGSFCL